MTQKFANNARSRLVGALTNVATTFTVESATADTFPVANTTDWFKATLENSLGQVEIIRVNTRGLGSGIFSDVVRGQDGTTAIAFDAGAVVGNRVTAEDIEESLALREVDGEFSGDNEFSGETDVTGTLMQNGIQARIIPVGGVIFWPRPVATIPAGWQLCDGTNGTPDMRDKFPIGASQDDAGVAKTNITGALTQTGGSKDAVAVSHLHSVSLTSGAQSANHTHSGTTTVNGDHAHAVTYASGSNTGSSYPSRLSESGITSVSTGNAGSHQHTMTTGVESATHAHGVVGNTASAGVAGTNLNLPPYYAGCWIQAMAYA